MRDEGETVNRVLIMKNESGYRFRIRAFIGAVIVMVLLLLMTIFFTRIGLVSMNLLDLILEYMAIILVVALFLAIAVAIINGRKFGACKDNVERFIRIAFFPALVIILGFIMLALSAFFKLEVRDEIKALLNKASPQIRVSVDGKFYEAPHEIIAELKKVAPLRAHGSHTTKRFDITIQDSNWNLKIRTGRDSSDPQEYWVFYPKYSYTKKQEIGRIRTSLFDDY